VGVAVALVDRLATRARHRHTGDRHRVAPPRLPLILDVEQSPTYRPTIHSDRRPRVDSDHGADPSALGRAANAR
jgi:hypothetical protein